MDGDATVARAIMRTLGNAGVPVLFGLPGVHNLAFWRVTDGPAIIGVRHEQTTVYAADGLARASGGLGVALTTTGPGAANAAAAFGEAAMSGSPVLLIASEIGTKVARPGVLRGALHESRDQATMFAPLAKAVFRPRTAESAVAAVAEAAELALTWPRGPVYVDIPMDVLGQPGEPLTPAAPRRRPPDRSALAAAVELIERAERVVLWAGGGVIQSDAEHELVELAERLCAPVVTTFGGRGAIPPDHPSAVGLPPHEREVAALIGDADLLLAVGTEFDGPNTRNWTMPRPPALVAINCDETDVAKNFPPDVAVVADAKLALGALAEAVGKRDQQLDHVARVQETIRQRLAHDPDSATPNGFLAAVDDVVARHDAVVVVDMAIPGYWIGGYGRIDGPRRLQYPLGWGTLGFALPASVGAGALRARPVLAVCGDGGVMFAIGELAVLRQERLPVTVLVVDDGGYGMLRYDQTHAGDPHRGVDLTQPDFAALAAAFGITAVTVDGVDNGLGPVLADALAAGEPRMVVLREAMTPPRTTSPRWGDGYAD
ncbi:MAG TPA: thiamine pyrophosphate-binding protein [Pseudonocardiaceae bacterium]|nr:thiamine pyrophosphate-binding protein [Pseudonocardiaceae bacterium]